MNGLTEPHLASNQKSNDRSFSHMLNALRHKNPSISLCPSWRGHICDTEINIIRPVGGDADLKSSQFHA